VKQYGDHRRGPGKRPKRKLPPRPAASEGPFELWVTESPGGFHLFVVHRFSRQMLASAYYCSDDLLLFEQFYEGSFMAKFLGQVIAAKQAATGADVACDPDFERLYPAIWEFVSVTRVDDKTTRQTSTLMLFIDGKVWKACLHDRDTGMSLWAAAEGFCEVLEALEAMLKSPAPQWRQGGQRKPKK